jgi:tmRNA-binding protein
VRSIGKILSFFEKRSTDQAKKPILTVWFALRLVHNGDAVWRIKMRIDSWLFLILSFSLGIGCAFIVRHYTFEAKPVQVAKALPTTKILVAKKDIPRDVEMTAEAVVFLEVPTTELPSDVMTSFAQVNRHRTIVPIPAGYPICSDLLLPAETNAPETDKFTPPGSQVITLEIDLVNHNNEIIRQPISIIDYFAANQRIDIQTLPKENSHSKLTERKNELLKTFLSKDEIAEKGEILFENIEIRQIQRKTNLDGKQTQTLTLVLEKENVEKLIAASRKNRLRIIPQFQKPVTEIVADTVVSGMSVSKTSDTKKTVAKKLAAEKLVAQTPVAEKPAAQTPVSEVVVAAVSGQVAPKTSSKSGSGLVPSTLAIEFCDPAVLEFAASVFEPIAVEIAVSIPVPAAVPVAVAKKKTGLDSEKNQAEIVFVPAVITADADGIHNKDYSGGNPNNLPNNLSNNIPTTATPSLNFLHYPIDNFKWSVNSPIRVNQPSYSVSNKVIKIGIPSPHSQSIDSSSNVESSNVESSNVESSGGYSPWHNTTSDSFEPETKKSNESTTPRAPQLRFREPRKI